MVNYVFIVTGFLLGFIIDYLGSGKRVRQHGVLPSLKFQTKRYRFHIHHWLGLLLILIILTLINYYNDFIYGFLVGAIIRSLSMRDTLRFITKKD
jgi:hypothetical protein